jgi:hypothetical protein
MNFDKHGNIPHIFRLAEDAGIDVFGDLFSHRYLSDTQGAFDELQDRYYPDSWVFAAGEGQEPMASYKVRCATPAELALAYALRPKGINAEIILDQSNTETVH